jgi:hypothetical protein
VNETRVPASNQSTTPILGGFFINEMAFPWGVAVNADTGNIYIGDLLAGGAPADRIFEYGPDGAHTGVTIDNSSISTVFGADIAYNNRTRMLWQAEVGADNCIHEIDPAAGAVTGNKICPAFGTSQRGLTYDPITNTFYSGSWNDSIIHQFDTEGTLLRSVNVGLAVSGLVINPVSGKLYVMQNTSTGFDMTILDANTPEFDSLSAFNLQPGGGITADPLAGGAQSGLTFTCDGTLWTPSRGIGGSSSNALIAFDSGETDFCEWQNLPWVDVELEFDTTSLDTGSFGAQLVIAGNTPYADSATAVSLNVTAPVRGDVSLVSTTVRAQNGQPALISVERVGGSDFEVTVDYELGSGTAEQGIDFIGLAGTLTWADGDTSPKTISINTVNQDTTEDIGFSVVITNPSEGVDIIRSTTAVIIEGDEPKDSGSLGFLLVALLAAGGLARRRYKF